MTGVCAVLDVTEKPGLMLFAEIAFPPLGYVVRFRDDDGDAVPESVADMPDLSFFGQYRLGQRAAISLTLPVRTPVGPTPGHYLGGA
jgi:hypothetical protein